MELRRCTRRVVYRHAKKTLHHALRKEWRGSRAASAGARARAECSGEGEGRRKSLSELETIRQEDGPIVQPLWRSVVTAMDKRVHGFQMHPTSYMFANEWAFKA